jgi:hypothetical protein
MLVSIRQCWYLVPFLPLATIALGCGPIVPGAGGAETPTADDAPPPPCNPAEAPLAKVMNTATADAYSDCTITVDATFNSPDWGGMVGGDIEGFVKWSALPPGGEAADFKMMEIPKSKSDAIFAFKRGDAIKVRGVAKTGMAGQVFFFASEISAAK